VILLDANLLVYAANHAAPEHAPARAWLDERLNASARVGLPWPSLLAFVRLVTNPKSGTRRRWLGLATSGGVAIVPGGVGAGARGATR
jgi:predicted nucleic acid-binding protein